MSLGIVTCAEGRHDLAGTNPAYADLRIDYGVGGLTEDDAGHDPIALFDRWISFALEAKLREPNAMTLATVSADGRPSARIVLLRKADDHGFTFFTNYDGRKARELEVNQNAALVFHWAELERQVRVEGVVAKTSEAESRDYFAQRPRGSQIGAWASPQSGVLPDRAALEAHFAAVEDRFAGVEVPLPPHWGGYRLRPSAIEFWQGRRSRLHDRLLFTRISDNEWRRERLAP